VALYLIEHGFRAWALKGGFAAWRDAGLPLAPVGAIAEGSMK